LALTNDSYNSNCALHLLDNGHALGPVDIMKVLFISNRGNRMPSVEKYYVYTETTIQAEYV